MTGARPLGARMSRTFQRKLGSVLQEEVKGLLHAAGHTLNWQDLSGRQFGKRLQKPLTQKV